VRFELWYGELLRERDEWLGPSSPERGEDVCSIKGESDDGPDRRDLRLTGQQLCAG